jgi:hypothetical protein
MKVSTAKKGNRIQAIETCWYTKNIGVAQKFAKSCQLSEQKKTG